MPHVWLSPLLTCTNSTLPSATRVGVSRCRPTLSPSSPCWLRPQQYATCDALTRHVWSVPALIWSKPTPPVTGTGLVASFVVPSPNSPCPFAPQQKAPLVVVMPHEWSRPALTERNAWPPATAAGAERLLNVESPTPLPQQYAYPATGTPQLRALPAVTDRTVRWTPKALLEAASKPLSSARSAQQP